MRATATMALFLGLTWLGAPFASAQEIAPGPIQPPRNLRVTDKPSDAGGSVILTWDLSPHDAGAGGPVVGYRVLRATSEDGPFRLLKVEGSQAKPAQPDVHGRGRPRRPVRGVLRAA